jgi:hypothetical protein
VTKIPERKTSKTKDLLWFTVSEDSACGFLAPFAWAKHHGGGNRWQWRYFT